MKKTTKRMKQLIERKNVLERRMRDIMTASKDCRRNYQLARKEWEEVVKAIGEEAVRSGGKNLRIAKRGKR